ncbi:MAG TPA: hypothetical protein VHL59_13185 [Thermoanaerobaculia bacterium]|nr:hypothetical protein [Thermoanaerobaculia bacterium]
MSRIIGLALALALLVGAGLFAVELLDDRELLVPPPDAVAEGFTREVLTKRYDCARDYLLAPDSVSKEELEALQQRLGEPQNVETKTTAQNDDEATVEVTLKETSFTVPLAFDDEWKIARLP